MDRLSPLDVSFLHIEDADRSAHMHIGSVAVFEGPPPPQAEMVAALVSRFHLVPRYRQRVQLVPLQLARPVWVDATDFDVHYHVRRTAVAAPGGDAQLRQLVGRIVSQRLDRTKPLWEIWIVEGLSGGQWAMISKVHHCMVDGVSATELMAALLSVTPETAPSDPVAWKPTPVTTGDITRDALHSLVTDTTEQVRAVRSAARRPAKVLHGLGEVLRSMRSMPTTLATSGNGALTGPVGSHRVVAWADAALDDVKQVRAALGGTVNDVVLAAVSNGYRELLLARGADVAGRVVRTMVPVSIRTRRADGAAHGDGTFDNKVSAMFASLPVGIADPGLRLTAIADQLAGLKQSKQALAGEALTSLSAIAPAALLALGARVAGRAAGGRTPIETVTTNVPGPQLPLYSVGRKMLRVYPYVPVAAPVRTSVAIFSYDGQLTFSVTGDRDSAADVDIVAAGIAHGIEQLVALSTATPRRGKRSAAAQR